MAASNNLIDFDVIEGQKENIQSLPGGRSARKLAELYSPSPLHKLATPTPSDTKNVHDCIRAEYETEIQNISDSDDPLDVFDRYVRWTLDAYPTAQATPQSQLHTLLERATKTFITSAQYKNDPRYLRLWVHYIHFFSDSPRETYMFLSRHGIGEGLALFYEEYAAWLEAAGRWAQAQEVYKLGIERESRPVQRLMRKYKEFEERMAQQPARALEPSSPALPTVRPALAAKVYPFGSSSRPSDPHAPRPSSSVGGASSKPAKSKLAIFSDADAKPAPLSSRGVESKGWESVGSLSDRKKENALKPMPWVGETLKAGGKKSAAPKMAVFRDPSLSKINNIGIVWFKSQVTVHPQTGRKEYIFVDLAAVYPTPEEPGSELSFEEIIAANRGWLGRSWNNEAVEEEEDLVPEPILHLNEIEEISRGVSKKLAIHRDPMQFDENGEMKEHQEPRVAKKKKIMEVNETQIIKAKLDSPSGPKFRKKITSEPTMTLHTKAATDDIYDIFNAPLKPLHGNESAEDDDYETDGEYTTDGESTGTTRHLDATSQPGDEATADAKSLAEWSNCPAQRHIAVVGEEVADGTLPTRSDDEGHNEEPEAGEQTCPTCPIEETIDGSIDEQSPPETRTAFIPIPPEDYEPPTRPYRDPAEVANNRLPFMTPITERTECSVDVDLERRDTFKTPCRRDSVTEAMREDQSDDELLSSPLREIVDGECPPPRIPDALVPKSRSTVKPPANAIRQKGPVIKDVQCNPVDISIREEILSNLQPPLRSYPGFHDRSEQKYERGADIRKFIKALNRLSKGGTDKTGPLPAPVTIEFPSTGRVYTLKRELGAGAFAPVYLVENSCPQEDENDDNAVVTMGKGMFAVSHRNELEALKMEAPPTPWEFYIMRLAHSRLGPQHRAAASLSYAHELQLYQDEGFLFLPYHPHGTLLDVVNIFRTEPSGVMDEQLAMFFSIELVRTVEALHTKNILHGDLKADNCLLRLDATSSEQPLSMPWKADGSGGWASRGIFLIDFGRGIDMKAFVPNVEFIADWKTSSQDCAEMREGRPWTWQIDYHGLAGIIHCLLFGKYIETQRCDQGGLGRTGRKYKIRESLKRYWQADLWSECFEVLLNPGSFLEFEDGCKMPVLKSLKSVRERMEQWLEANCDRGVGLRSLISKLEGYAKSRR
ncbi:Mitotic checkpoint serine/threonine protein kinase, Bub1 [Metarhizium album ARSEF 1941]|uniref:Mitotic checkpoint serine/threonine protein kinase, Bub1 n=1 Tax=Metarhizium album (strain ARSEF 1941) TaxID=1081103 RepID=A0A0B2WWY8_METAS|nr:Mitotic checkpoint serine/threonine protein kinase, Bub1 [Metarhizium album ARSEF 1941]KHN98573.1 Mitotic checkpoint serine/threonine protein kinase, Bub1 [Metarhizium album ARSEF 1941]